MDNRVAERLIGANRARLAEDAAKRAVYAPKRPDVQDRASRPGAPRSPSPCRPGTELKAILKDWLGIEATAGCGCNDMAARMDALGPDWCENAGMPEILDTMKAEHAKRWAAGQTRLPWTDLGARQLVKLACRRAKNALTKDATG